MTWTAASEPQTGSAPMRMDAQGVLRTLFYFSVYYFYVSTKYLWVSNLQEAAVKPLLVVWNIEEVVVKPFTHFPGGCSEAIYINFK